MDNNLKDNKSVFIMSEGEHKKFIIDNDSKLKSKIEELTNFNIKLLNIVNKFFCVTLNQLLRITKNNIVTLETILERLESNNIINSCIVLDKNDNIILKFYFLTEKAKEILLNNNISINEFTVRNKNLIELKKILEWNELFISFIEKNKRVIKYNNNMIIFSEFYKDSIKISGGYIKFYDKNQHYVFEIIRNEKDLEIKLRKKMSRYKDFYDNYKLLNLPPKLILVCENDRQILNIFKNLIFKEFEQYFFSFTTDLRINKLELINFKLDRNKSKWISIKSYI